MNQEMSVRRADLGNLSQQDVANRAGVSLSTVSRLERGVRVAAKQERAVEDALGWGPGSIEAIHDGREPTAVAAAAEPTSKPVAPDASINIEAYASLLDIAHQSSREEYIDTYQQTMGKFDQATRRAIRERFSELATERIHEHNRQVLQRYADAGQEPPSEVV
ncbi:MAG: helix-turn-helix transcriptional regulator [Streptosporangiales bacterium]